MRAIVVNFKTEKCDVKVCRLPDNSIPSPPNKGFLGNPYTMPPFTRDEACNMYDKYFQSRIKDDESFRNAVNDLLKLVSEGPVKLGCMCHPLRCHADTIANYLNGIAQ